MLRKDRIYQFIISACSDDYDQTGVTAQIVADALSLWRNDVSVELNKLVAEGKLSRSGKKNVFFSLPIRNSLEQTTFAPEMGFPRQTKLSQMSNPTAQNVTAFSRLVGSNGSLKHQIHVAKAAVSYPPCGLNMLITGSTGVGKSLFGHTVWEYAKSINAFHSANGEIPFIHFNCAEYADNPQLLLSNLFGYRKGAFTGAIADKAGLVEEANGGILMLDEVHCLSSTGQELFFTLLDTGFYRRVGDNIKRESHFMLIGATTKSVADSLLDTFVRRMPVLIQIPNLAQRPFNERYEFIEFFYIREAARIGHKIIIKKDVLNALLGYTFQTNLGMLKNAIQISCAKAFLRNKTSAEENNVITVALSDLSFQVCGLAGLATDKNDAEAPRFSTNMIVSPGSRAEEDYTLPSFMDIYDYIEHHFDTDILNDLDAEALHQKISLQLDHYYEDLERTLKESNTDIELLNSIIAPGTVQISTEFISMAAGGLGRTYSSTIPMLLAMHLSQYVDRMRSGQPILSPELRTVLKGNMNEIHFLEKNREWLSTALGVQITSDELDILAIFLRQNAVIPNLPGVWITVISCNDKTASSMGTFVKSICNSNHLHWMDNRSLKQLELMFEDICANIRSYHGETGNLIFTDIKVLTGLEEELHRATGVRCRAIPVLEQHLLLDACRITQTTDCGLDETYHKIIKNYRNSMMKFFDIVSVMKHPADRIVQDETLDKVVLSVCVTGAGSAKSIKDILELKFAYIPNLTFIPMSSLENVEQKVREYGASLKLIIGTVNPNVPNVPFVSADRVFTTNGIYLISTILEDWQQSVLNSNEKSTGEELDHILWDSFSLIAPNVNRTIAVQCITNLVSSLESDIYMEKMPEDVKVKLFMHAAGMLERIEIGNPMGIEEHCEEVILRNMAWFQLLSKTIVQSFQPIGYEIPRAEHYYFMLSLPGKIE